MSALIFNNIITKCLVVTAVAVCGLLPATAARAAVSETTLTPPMSINDVWMQYGGARLHYLALAGARQAWSGGAIGADPASLPKLPPLKPWSEGRRSSYSGKKNVTAKTVQPAPSPAAKPQTPPPAYKPLTKSAQEAGDPLGGAGPSSYSAPPAAAPASAPAPSPPAAPGAAVSVPKPPVSPAQQLWPSPDAPLAAPRSITPVTPPAAPSAVNGVNIYSR